MLKKIYKGEFTEQQAKFSSIIGKPLGEILRLTVFEADGPGSNQGR